jgi:hypothetical protein
VARTRVSLAGQRAVAHGEAGTDGEGGVEAPVLPVHGDRLLAVHLLAPAAKRRAGAGRVAVAAANGKAGGGGDGGQVPAMWRLLQGLPVGGHQRQRRLPQRAGVAGGVGVVAGGAPAHHPHLLLRSPHASVVLGRGHRHQGQALQRRIQQQQGHIPGGEVGRTGEGLGWGALAQRRRRGLRGVGVHQGLRE